MNMELFRQMLLHSIGAFGGTLGYAFLLNAPLCTVLPASLTGLLGYVLYEVMINLLGQSMIFSYFVATVIIAVICEIAARVMRMPSTIFLLMGVMNATGLGFSVIVARRIGENRYRLTLRYEKEDETEMLIRVLSFGPALKVISPGKFRKRIKDRIERQMGLWDGE